MNSVYILELISTFGIILAFLLRKIVHAVKGHFYDYCSLIGIRA